MQHTASTCILSELVSSEDLWHDICGRLDPAALSNLSQVDRHVREQVSIYTKRVDLSGLKPVMNQGELVAALGISVSCARSLPHKEETRRGAMGWYHTHVYTISEVLPAILERLGGWEGLAVCQASRDGRKRKREELNERREAAAKKRRAALDAWISKALPLGAEIDSLDGWEKYLVGMGADEFARDVTLGAYLGSQHLKAPSFKSAKEAVVSFHRSQIEQCERKKVVAAEMRISKGERETTIVRALGALGLVLRADSRLCELYINGASEKTADEVATVMAKMKYIHEYVDKTWLEHAIDMRIERIGAECGEFFPGIRNVARREVHEEIGVPGQWPWL